MSTHKQPLDTGSWDDELCEEFLSSYHCVLSFLSRLSRVMYGVIRQRASNIFTAHHVNKIQAKMFLFASSIKSEIVSLNKVMLEQSESRIVKQTYLMISAICLN